MKKHHFSGQHQANLAIVASKFNCVGIIVGEKIRQAIPGSAYDVISFPIDNLLDRVTKWLDEGSFSSKIEPIHSLMTAYRNVHDKVVIQAKACQGRDAKGPFCTCRSENL